MRDLVAGLAPGTRYVLCVLEAVARVSARRGDLESALGAADRRPRCESIATDGYAAVAGLAGAPPALVTEAGRAVSQHASGWTASTSTSGWNRGWTSTRFGGWDSDRWWRRDTTRLIVERGVSFVAFDERGRAVRMGYAAGLFAPEARYVIPASR